MSETVILRDEDYVDQTYTVTNGVKIPLQGGGYAVYVPQGGGSNEKYYAMINRTIDDVSAADIAAAGLGEYSFAGCNQMTGTIVVPSGTTEIPRFCFTECSAGFATLPSSIEIIGESAFAYTDIVDSVVTNLQNLTTIADNAFIGCSFLHSFSVPDYCEVGAGAFEFSGLQSISVGNGAMLWGNYTFALCDLLTSFSTPVGSWLIGAEAMFANSRNIASVVLDISGLRGAMHRTFAGCSSLLSITLNGATSVPTADATTFGADLYSGVPSNCVIYVPSNLVSAFQADQYFGAFTIQAIS